MTKPPIQTDEEFTASVAQHLAKRYAGVHKVIIEPGAAGPFRVVSREGKPDRAGVRLTLSILDGPAKGERLEFHLAFEGAPKRTCGDNADILIGLAEATDASGDTPAELINSAARKLFPTSNNPSPLPVTATIAATVVQGSSRPFLNLKALTVGDGND
jgi:hypothetical protein